MIDIFTASLGVISVCALTGAVFKILLAPPKKWDEEDDWRYEEIETVGDYDELRKKRPHIWID